MKTYTTIQGDTFDGIAFSQLGSCSYTDLLIQENIGLVNHFTIPPGTTIIIPDVDTSSVVESDDLTPPWKAVAG